MARRNEHSLEEIKEKVLGAAETIIIEEGYSALTARRIAMDIGYTVASIYMVFVNMADLVTHVKAKTVDELNEQLQQVQACTPEQHITELSKTYLQFAARNYNRWSLIYQQLGESPEWYQQKINLLFSPVEAQLTRLAPDSSSQQIKLAARTLWSSIHGICTLSLDGQPDMAQISVIENAIILLEESFLRGWPASRKAQ